MRYRFELREAPLKLCSTQRLEGDVGSHSQDCLQKTGVLLASVSSHAHCEGAAAVVLPAMDARGDVQYVWDGRRVLALSVEEACSQTVTRHQSKGEHGLLGNLGMVNRKFFHVLHKMNSAFFPNPLDVTPDYWEYVKWRGWHRLFSSMSSIFSTQSLLLAVGVGAKKTLPSAAAINWVLKDGLGRLGRLTVATKFGESFDADLKRFRFTSSLLYAVALSLDYLTPLAPAHFLPMAALANVGKSVGLTTYIATQPAFHKSFAKTENLADISAKAQAQQMAVDTCGLALAVSINMALRNQEAARRVLPLALLPFLVTGDLFSIYNELRSVHLRTLNKERAEHIAAQWVDKKFMPSPEDVSKQERFVLPPKEALGDLPLQFGSLEHFIRSREDVDDFIKSVNENQKYTVFISRQHSRDLMNASLRSDTTSREILEVILLAAYLRKDSERKQQKHFKRAQARAKREVSSFTRHLCAKGWQVEPFTLNRAERKFYK